MRFAGAALEADWRTLCETIGERLAGTPAEKAAADYIVEQLRAVAFPSHASNRFRA